ncbi:hypothetical protein CKAH01_14803 [Colletotrichum kahawae]|uniref:Uncharacterized protein n=1 Tax=Colletotrichum kahawae TaxID=34407 RepID=A0AAD9YMN6_COLKA|nr:hypothetical protein CKAH01_14803 [Colletotrichum kahawae]
MPSARGSPVPVDVEWHGGMRTVMSNATSRGGGSIEAPQCQRIHRNGNLVHVAPGLAQHEPRPPRTSATL